jgi:pimeloyl-ACP methyl ester carboxylesterase
MSGRSPVVVLVHGAFAGSASWNGVIELLLLDSIEVVAVSNPLRSIRGDAAYVRDVIAAIGRPVILVAHSYGGMVITEAAAHNDAVKGLVYVCAFAPEPGEGAFHLLRKFPGGTLGEALVAVPLSTGGRELAIMSDAFHRQFAADVPAGQAATMCATQRPVTETALVAGLPTDAPAWKTLPCWFAFGDEDLIIPIALHRYMARRAGALCIREVAGASHALSVSNPDVVTASILDALAS